MKALFLSAAWFNWLVAIVFIVAIRPLFELIGASPAPTEMVFVHFFSIVVFSFGIAYYWISLDPENNKPLIKLGAIAKMLLVIVGVADVAIGLISWHVLMLLSVDFMYSILFFYVYSKLEAA